MIDPSARGFEEWYCAEHPKLLGSLTLVAGDLHSAREAADEALSRALEHWDRVRLMESPGGWTYRVALNVLRRRQRRAAIERRLLVRRAPVASVPAPAGEAWDAVRHLPARQRTAVVLRHVGGLTEQEIGIAMGIQRGTVSATLRSAYATLRTTLADEDAEGAEDRA